MSLTSRNGAHAVRPYDPRSGRGALRAPLLVPVLFRLLLGGVFVAAGSLKALDPATFANDVARYGLVPDALVNVFSLALPWIEILAGGLLVVGVWKRESAAVIAALNAVFLVAVSVALARGLEVCGCFGAAVARKASAWTLVEDAVFLAAALWLCRTKGDNDETNRGGN